MTDFATRLAKFSGTLRLAIPSAKLDAADKHLLKDVHEGRYPFVTFCRMTRIVAQSPRVEHHVELAEIVRQSCRPERAQQCVTAAFDVETQVTGDANVPQREYERRRCDTSRDAVLVRLYAQLAATLNAIDAVEDDRSADARLSDAYAKYRAFQ